MSAPPRPTPTSPVRWPSLIALLGLALTMALTSGCNIVAGIGALEEARRRNSTQTIDPVYTGLQGKSFAVVVTADRVIQSDFPDLLPRLTTFITDDLVRNQPAIQAAGMVPAADVLQYQYNNPRWITLSYGRLAEQLGVQRLIIVDLLEYRLFEPGNKYLWSGRAAATVNIMESDGPLPDEAAFSKQLKVKFPDKDGIGPADMDIRIVNTELSRRLGQRASWLFYAHEEPYYPDF
ncbi:MAG: hypothetical protein ACK5ZV_10505 [bacterium]